MTTIITQDHVLRLNDENITLGEYNLITEEINNRVEYIWKTLLELSGRKLVWWAFENDCDYGHGNGSSGGFFDPETDGEFIELTGEYGCRDIDGDFKTGFPTRFLWTEDSVWQGEVLTHINNNKKEKVNREREERLKKKTIIASIKSKLTPEELKYVSIRE